MLTDAGIIADGIFLLIRVISYLLGRALVLAIITLAIRLPVAGLGFIFLFVGTFLFLWQYENARLIVSILRDGQGAFGEITHGTQNYHFRVNGR